MKPTVLVLCDTYLPGHHSGGPVRSISGVVANLHQHFDFKIVTRDRHVGDPIRYRDIPPSRGWLQIGHASVLHLSPRELAPYSLGRVLRETRHDVLYVNSAFSLWLSIMPLALRTVGIIPRRPTIVAPRGEFGLGSMAIRSTNKKRVYLRAALALGAFRQVAWQASSAIERAQIETLLRELVRGTGRSADFELFVARNLSPVVPNESVAPSQKKPGTLRAVSLGRIVPIKNLLYAIERLSEVHGEVSLDAYGPIQDASYWAQCEAAAAKSGIQLAHKGILAHDEVAEVLSSYDVMVTPTKNENFGHAILEALCAGCPVLVSENTPWANLQGFKAGWTVPLATPAMFTAVLQHCTDLSGAELDVLRAGALAYAKDCVSDPSAREAHLEMFTRKLCRRG